MSHTPTPWRIDGAWVLASATADIARMNFNPQLMDLEEFEANCAFIVRACNAHDELVAALRALLGDGPKAGEPGHIDFRDAIVMARAALAKVQAHEHARAA